MQTYLCLTALVVSLSFHRGITDPHEAAGGIGSPASNGSEVPPQVPGSIPLGSNGSVASNQTVRVVVPSTKHEAGRESPEDPPPNEKARSEAENDKKPAPKKAPKPVAGMAESVGYVPRPEEKQREEKPAVEQDRTVRMIPTLPPGIIQPGRMLNGSWFIVLYAPWCEYSKQALAEFVTTVQYIVDKNISNMVVGKIDIIKHNEVAKHFRVKNTPTIVLVRDGFRYTFDRANITRSNLINFMLAVINFSVVEVNSSLQLELLQPQWSSLFLIVYNEEVDRDWHPIYMRQATEKCLKAKFAYTTSTDIAKKLKLDMLPAIVALKDNTVVHFKGSLSMYALAKWILTEKDVAFPIVNDTNVMNYLQPVADVVVDVAELYYPSPDNSRRLAILVVRENLGRRSRGETSAVSVSRSVALGRNHHSKFQFLLAEGGAVPALLLRRSVGSYPFFFVYEPYTGLYYAVESKSLSEESIAKFFENIMSGKEEPKGGITYLDQIIYFFKLANAVFKSMLFHRPYLSAATAFCMCGVTSFYLYVYLCRQSKKESKSDLQLRKAARTRRRKEMLEKKREQERKEEEVARRRIEAKEKSVSQLRNRGVSSRSGRGEEDEQGSCSDSELEGSQAEESQEERLHED